MDFEESEEKIRRFSSCLISAYEEERKRISIELNEDLGQSLDQLNLWLKNAREQLSVAQSAFQAECERMGRLVLGMLNTVGRISAGLTPLTQTDFSLTESLRRLTNDLGRRAGLEISVKMEDMDGLFSPAARLAIYRVFQDALMNVVKHAGADRMLIEAYKENGSAFFIIKDEGIGFNIKRARDGRIEGNSGLGLTSMEARVVMLKGQFKIDSQLFEGTQILFRIPFEPVDGR